MSALIPHALLAEVLASAERNDARERAVPPVGHGIATYSVEDCALVARDRAQEALSFSAPGERRRLAIEAAMWALVTAAKIDAAGGPS